MSNRTVINTGPLIALSRVGCLAILAELPYEFLYPEQVRRELDEGEAAGYPRILPAGVALVPLAAPLSRIGATALDPGEAAVIQLAIEQGIPWVVIDELKGRRAALAAGLQVTGSLGLLAKARTLGLVPRLQPLLEIAAREGVRYHPELVRAVFSAVGD